MINKLRQTQKIYQDNPTNNTKKDWLETKQLYDISADEIEKIQKDFRDLKIHKHGNKSGKLLSHLTKEHYTPIKMY